jgi:hypothetical protein
MAGLMIAIANSISSNYVVSGGGFDPDAEAFIVATGTTNPTEQTAINELVLNLKNANIWTKFNALYPFIGSTATSQKFNLKNPLDTDAAFRLNFVGGWTHSSSGALPNGTNAYANSFLSTSTIGLNSVHLSYYSRTNSTSGGSDMGALQNSPNSYTDLALNQTGFACFTRINSNGAPTSVANADTRGFYVGNRTASNVLKLFKNSNIILTSADVSNATSTRGIFIGGLNNAGTPSFYSNRQCAFSSIGISLTDLEAQVFSQIVEGYQFALSRNINPSQSFYYNRNYSVETNAYLYSTQITDVTTQGAINTLVSDLKGYGIWTKMKAIYPFAGSTATQQKFNLVNSQDTNAAFRLTFAGGWTHSSNGALPNGTNAYASTNIIPNTHLTNNSTHMSYYSRTNTNILAASFDMGINGSTSASYFDMSLRLSDTFYSDQYNTTTNRLTTANTNSTGFYITSRTTSTSLKSYKNGTQIGSTLTNASSGFSGLIYGIYIGAINNNNLNAQFFTNREVALISIGDGLTDTESANFRTAVQTYQTTLGRQV